jgi:hypothetical protein
MPFSSKIGLRCHDTNVVAHDAISRENGIEMPWQIRTGGSRKSIEERVLYDIFEVTRLICHGEI